MQKNQERKPRNRRRGRAREFVMNHDRDHAERGDVNACDLPMSRSTASVLNPRDWALSRRREMSAASVNGRSFRRGISLDYVIDHPPNDIMRWPRRTADPQRGIERSIRGVEESCLSTRDCARYGNPLHTVGRKARALTRGKISIAKPVLPEVRWTNRSRRYSYRIVKKRVFFPR